MSTGALIGLRENQSQRAGTIDRPIAIDDRVGPTYDEFSSS